MPRIKDIGVTAIIRIGIVIRYPTLPRLSHKRRCSCSGYHQTKSSLPFFHAWSQALLETVLVSPVDDLILPIHASAEDFSPRIHGFGASTENFESSNPWSCSPRLMLRSQNAMIMSIKTATVFNHMISLAVISM